MLKTLVVSSLLLISTNLYSSPTIKMNDKLDFDWKKHEWVEGNYYYVGTWTKNGHYQKTRYSSTDQDSAKEYGVYAAGNLSFISASINRNNLIISAIAHNPSTTHYQCFYFSSSESSVHLDDELASEYKGATITIDKNLDNKLALNQRKKITISLPRPSDEADIVNLHLGINFVPVLSEEKCKAPVADWRMNFHKLDWNIAPLRSN